MSRPVDSEPLAEVVDTEAEASGLDQPPLIVRESLEAELGFGDLRIERASAGHSNITFFLEGGGRRLVLRRPPRGPLEPSAHDVMREYRILKALEGFDVRAPRAVAACTDESVIGAPFYVMERVDGVVPAGATPAPLDNPDDRGLIGPEMIDTLLELHAVPWGSSEALTRIGRPDGYLERQVGLWAAQWERRRTRPVEAIEAVGEELVKAIPQTAEATIVHGDFKLDNVVFAATSPTRAVAILDWEMATLGDPLADLGFLTATWLQGEDAGRLIGLSPASAEPGYSRRGELVERYAERSGRSVERLAWYQALALWKLAILLEGSYGRFLAGTTDDPFFARLEQGVPALGEQARAALEGTLLD